MLAWQPSVCKAALDQQCCFVVLWRGARPAPPAIWCPAPALVVPGTRPDVCTLMTRQLAHSVLG